MGEVFGGRYELVDPLASGGAGVVWRVWDRRDHEYKAGKVLKQSDSASLLRFMRETGWRINHPHVVTPLGWVGEDDRVMFTMQLIRGGTLSSLLRQHGPLPPIWAKTATDQLLDALEKVHGQGLVHRDVKPANLMLQPTADHAMANEPPLMFLSDFGIAAPVGEPRMTRVTEVIGTPGYMSPEAELGLDPEPRQDLYAVGVVLLEMLTGQRPPKEGRPVIPPAAAEVPLGQFIADLLADETKRIPTAAEARARLAETPLPTSRAVPVRVTDQIPPLPDGWDLQGPIQGRPQNSTPPVPPATFAPTTLRTTGGTPTTGPQHRGEGAPPVGWGMTQNLPVAPPGPPTPTDQFSQGQSAQGQSAQSQFAQGQSAQGQSAQGQFAQGQFAQGQFGSDPVPAPPQFPPGGMQPSFSTQPTWQDKLGVFGTPIGLAILIVGVCVLVALVIVLALG